MRPSVLGQSGPTHFGQPVCEHGLVDHCRHGPTFCSKCGHPTEEHHPGTGTCAVCTEEGNRLVEQRQAFQRCRICGEEIKDPSTEWVEHYLKHKAETSAGLRLEPKDEKK